MCSFKLLFLDLLTLFSPVAACRWFSRPMTEYLLYFSVPYNPARVVFFAHSKLAFDYSSYCIICWDWPMEMYQGMFGIKALESLQTQKYQPCWINVGCCTIGTVSWRASEFPLGTILQGPHHWLANNPEKRNIRETLIVSQEYPTLVPVIAYSFDLSV